MPRKVFVSGTFDSCIAVVAFLAEAARGDLHISAATNACSA
jgi:hypothetical protein